MVSVKTLALPHGLLESYTCPKEAKPDTYYPLAAVVHNNGDATGGIAIGIANYSGPGNIIVKYGGNEQVIAPGYVSWYYATSVPVCQRIGLDAEIKFSVEGDYVIWILGGHLEDTTVVGDTYVAVDG